MAAPWVSSPTLRWPGLSGIRDQTSTSGTAARAGARGQTTLVDGRPSSYTVVAGDYLDAIAARFSLKLNELFYLNPARTPSPLSTVTQVGEVLNLSKSYR